MQQIKQKSSFVRHPLAGQAPARIASIATAIIFVGTLLGSIPSADAASRTTKGAVAGAGVGLLAGGGSGAVKGAVVGAGTGALTKKGDKEKTKDYAKKGALAGAGVGLLTGGVSGAAKGAVYGGATGAVVGDHKDRK